MNKIWSKAFVWARAAWLGKIYVIINSRGLPRWKNVVNEKNIMAGHGRRWLSNFHFIHDIYE